MKTTVNHPIHGEIVYTETAFLGKKSITVNGVEAVAISKKEFMIDGKHATLKGSFLFGATLCLEGESIEVCPKPHGYEIFLAVVPFLILLIWGNVPALCTIFPVVGGMIGGALYGVGAVLSLFLMKNASNEWLICGFSASRARSRRRRVKYFASRNVKYFACAKC